MTFAWSNFNKVTHASDSKTIKFEQGNLKFAKFKLQINVWNIQTKVI